MEVHEEPNPTNGMATQGTPAIVLGPTGNQQGTYKFMSLATGKKIKRREFTKYPMPDSVIKRVETLGKKANNNAFDFSDRNGILFKWNDEVDKHQERLVEEDTVLYPSLVAEFPGVALDRDLPIPSIEEEFAPQGRAEDVAALNANIAPYAVAGVNGPVIVNADNGEIEIYNDDDDDGIIDVLNLPRHADIDYGGHIGADDDNSNNGNIDDDDSDDEDNDDEDGVGGTDENLDAAALDEDVSIPGVRRSKRKNRGKTTRYEA